jgi:hypothetical protein
VYRIARGPFPPHRDRACAAFRREHAASGLFCTVFLDGLLPNVIASRW